MKYLRGYRAVALLQMLVSIGFFASPTLEIYGTVFGIINFFGAGILFSGSLLAYIKPIKWIIMLMISTMICMICFNTVWFAWHGVFLSTGFPLIAYNTLFTITSLHFLGKGL